MKNIEYCCERALHCSYLSFIELCVDFVVALACIAAAFILHWGGTFALSAAAAAPPTANDEVLAVGVKTLLSGDVCKKFEASRECDLRCTTVVVGLFALAVAGGGGICC